MGTVHSLNADGTSNERTTVLSSRVFRFAHMRRYSEIASTLVRYGFVDVHAMHLTPYLKAGR